MNEVYHIPANYTDAGRLFGAFAIRNAVEAAALALPLFFLLMGALPFAILPRVVITMIVAVPAGGFGLLGIAGEPLTRWLWQWRRWRLRRRILTHGGGAA